MKLRQGRFKLDIRKKFFIKRVVEHRDRLPRVMAHMVSSVGQFYFCQDEKWHLYVR